MIYLKFNCYLHISKKKFNTIMQSHIKVITFIILKHIYRIFYDLKSITFLNNTSKLKLRLCEKIQNVVCSDEVVVKRNIYSSTAHGSFY